MFWCFYSLTCCTTQYFSLHRRNVVILGQKATKCNVYFYVTYILSFIWLQIWAYPQHTNNSTFGLIVPLVEKGILDMMTPNLLTLYRASDRWSLGRNFRPENSWCDLEIISSRLFCDLWKQPNIILHSSSGAHSIAVRLS